VAISARDIAALIRNSAFGRRITRMRRTVGIAAPQVVVRPCVPVAWYLWGGALGLLVILFLLWLVFFSVSSGQHSPWLDELRHKVLMQQEELSRLRSTEGTGANLAQLERSSQQSLILRLQALERENVALKEDLRIFERLVPGTAEAGVVRIESFRAEAERDGGFRYSALLAFQPNKQTPSFRGRVELLAVFIQGGKELAVVLPDSGDASGSGLLEIKNFLRREGAFVVPKGAQLKSVEIRVLQGDTLKTKRTLQF
jgi:hypothetical protein